MTMYWLKIFSLTYSTSYEKLPRWRVQTISQNEIDELFGEILHGSISKGKMKKVIERLQTCLEYVNSIHNSDQQYLIHVLAQTVSLLIF